MDMIGSLVLEDSLNSEKTKNTLAVALLSQVGWHLGDSELNPFVRYCPVCLWHQLLNSRHMNEYVGKELDKRYASYKGNLESGKAGEGNSVIGLVLDGYLKQNGGVKQLPPRLDKTFRSYATYQIRTFLFAGRDTTSSSLYHAYYLLHKHTETLRRPREEHDSVLGNDPATAADVIVNDPNTLNQMVYTTSVIKETLRLFPPAAGARQ